MLGKLIKYEFKATGRILLPINAAMLLFALINRLFMELNFFDAENRLITAVAASMAVLYVLMIFGAFVITLIVTIQRFYKNLLTDEGYLMFTLPVKPHSHITAKGIAAYVWNLFSIIVMFASIFILVVNPRVMDSLGVFFQTELPRFMQVAGPQGVLLVVEVIAALALSLAFSILIIYVSIAIGSLFNTHKIIGSFVAYIAITTATQIITTIVISIVGFSAFGSTSAMNDGINFITYSLMPITIVLVVVLAAIFYVVTNVIFTRKLNLE